MSAQGELLRAALLGQVGAGAAASSVLLAAARPWRGRDHPLRPWGPPLALAAGTLTGYWLTRGAPSLPPTQALHWLFLAALAAGVIGAQVPYHPRIGGILGSGLALVQPWLVLAFQRARYWERVEGLVWCAVLGLILLGAWRSLACRAGPRGAWEDLGLALGMGCAAPAYGLGGGALFAQLAGAFALSVGLCALLGLWRGASALASGGALPLACVHAAFVWLAHWLYELSLPSFVLLSLVPFASLAVARLPAGRAGTAAALLTPFGLGLAAFLFEFSAADTTAYG